MENILCNYPRSRFTPRIAAAGRNGQFINATLGKGQEAVGAVRERREALKKREIEKKREVREEMERVLDERERTQADRLKRQRDPEEPMEEEETEPKKPDEKLTPEGKK